MVTDRAAALNACKSCSGGPPTACFGGEVRGREVFKLLIESIVVTAVPGFEGFLSARSCLRGNLQKAEGALSTHPMWFKGICDR